MNTWKLTTIGLLMVLGTSLTTGLATAYFMGEGSRKNVALTPPPAPMPPAPRRAAVYHPTRPAVRYVPVAAPVAPVPQPAVASSCDQNAKLVRVAKDGVVGGILGAAVGAGAGAIADGGHAAGKGAGIGALTGAVAGSLYGLNENRTSCGSAWR